MSYKYSFADNAIYSAEDVNKITKRLVTSGIEDSFEDGVAYNVSKFNEVGKQIYTSGVVPESCMTMKVTYSGDGKVLINPGLAFFDDGSVIEIEAGGEELAYTKGAVNYVYLKNDLESANISYPCCTTDEPVGDYVMLAVIDTDGNIKDKRTYAHGKLPGYQSLAMGALYINENVEFTLTDPHLFEEDVVFDIGANNFKHIFAVSKSVGDRCETSAFYNIEDGSIISFARKNSTDCILNTTAMYLYFDTNRKRITAVPSLADGKLTLSLYAYAGTEHLGTVGEKFLVNISLILV